MTDLAPLMSPLSMQELDLTAAPLDGRTLIEAAAGTGKTFAITRLYLRLLLERELPVSAILVVTFTDAATRELKERVRAVVREALAAALGDGTVAPDPFVAAMIGRVGATRARLLLQQALHGFDAASVYTIHGFCRQVLFEYAFESATPFTAAIIADQREIVDRAAADFWRRGFCGASTLFIAYAKSAGCADPSFFQPIVRHAQRSGTVAPADGRRPGCRAA